MPGRGCPPKVTRRRRNAPTRGDWQVAASIGWQHGPIPEPPDGMLKASRETWDIWMRAGFAAYWGPEDVPVLRMVIQLYDMVERGAASASLRAEFRQLADNYGITPKGRQDRRWTRPVGDQAVAPAAETKPSRYAHLRTVTPA